MIKVIYDYLSDNSYSDKQVVAVAHSIVASYGNSEQEITVTTGQVLFIDALRAEMANHNFNPSNLYIDLYDENRNIIRIDINDRYRFSDPSALPSTYTDVLFDILDARYRPE